MAGAVALARCGLAFDDGAGRAGQDDSDAADLITDTRHGASIDLRAADDSAGLVECYRLRHSLVRLQALDHVADQALHRVSWFGVSGALSSHDAGGFVILHRSAERLRRVYRLAECPVGAILINSPLGLRLGASFSNHPMHALRCAPNVAIHWK